MVRAFCLPHPEAIEDGVAAICTPDIPIPKLAVKLGLPTAVPSETATSDCAPSRHFLGSFSGRLVPSAGVAGPGVSRAEGEGAAQVS